MQSYIIKIQIKVVYAGEENTAYCQCLMDEWIQILLQSFTWRGWSMESGVFAFMYNLSFQTVFKKEKQHICSAMHLDCLSLLV